jgi:metal-responsive CopG/Arc/MetJ family transcriptional regulator
MNRYKPTCFSLSEKDLSKLDRLAAERNFNRSETIRFLVRNKRLAPVKQDLLDIAAGVAGASNER